MLQKISPFFSGRTVAANSLQSRPAQSPILSQPSQDTVQFAARANEPAMRKLSKAEAQAAIQDIRRDGITVLRKVIPVEKIGAMSEAFDEVYKEALATGNYQDRGNESRAYVPLPFRMPFADPQIYGNPDLIRIVKGAAGTRRIRMSQLASDTPVLGSTFQTPHADTSHFSPGKPNNEPYRPFQFAINYCLIPVRDQSDGPLYVMRGTQGMVWPKKEQGESAESFQKRRDAFVADMIKKHPPEPVYLEPGDVVIRDVTLGHFGSPSNKPRTMIVQGLDADYHNRMKEQAMTIPMLPEEKASIPPHLLRTLRLDLQPVFPNRESIPKVGYKESQLEILTASK